MTTLRKGHHHRQYSLSPAIDACRGRPARAWINNITDWTDMSSTNKVLQMVWDREENTGDTLFIVPKKFVTTNRASSTTTTTTTETK